MIECCLTLYQKADFLYVTKLKAFADNKLNVAKMTIFLLERTEHTVGKGENAQLPAFSPFPSVFPKPPSLGSLKVGIV